MISINISIGVIVFNVLMNRVFSRLMVIVVGLEISVNSMLSIRLIKICFIRLFCVRWESYFDEGVCVVIIYFF